jgi:hypothetical protein
MLLLGGGFHQNSTPSGQLTNLYKPHEGLYYCIATEDFMYISTMVGEAPNSLKGFQHHIIASSNGNVGNLLWGFESLLPMTQWVTRFSKNIYIYSPHSTIHSRQHLYLFLYKDAEDPTSSELSPSTATLDLANPCQVFLCSSRGERFRKCWLLALNSGPFAVRSLH